MSVPENTGLPATLAGECDFLTDVLSSVQDGILVLDSDLKVVMANAMIKNMFLDRLPLEGQAANRLFPGAGESVGAATLADGRPVRSSCMLETASGQREFSLYTYPLLERRTGLRKGVILNVRDVTTERELQQQLFQAQKMDIIGRLAGGMAHDFNNILQAILGFTEILAADIPEDHPSHADVMEIRKSTQRAMTLTRQLLAFGRKQVLSIADLDLNTLAGNMGNMLQRLIGVNYHLHYDLEPGMAMVHGDSGQLEQVILNLVINARDAMPAGGVITIGTRRRIVLADEAVRRGPPWRTGAYFCLSVVDRGTGIPPDILPRLFEPFFTTKGKGKGTGLGLSVVYGIVQQHGGWVEVATQVGEGSTFTIYLSASEPSAAKDGTT